MKFGMITLTKVPRQSKYATWILKALLFILKQKIFMRTLLMMLKKWFDTSKYDNNRLLPIGKNKNVIGLFKDELE